MLFKSLFIGETLMTFTIRSGMISLVRRLDSGYGFSNSSVVVQGFVLLFDTLDAYSGILFLAVAYNGLC